MKKMSALLMAVLLALSLISCGAGSDEGNKPVAPEGDTQGEDISKAPEEKEDTVDVSQLSAEEILNHLKEKGVPIGEIMVYDEETDENGILGRPGYYIGKASFTDASVEPNEYDPYNGGTVEVFSSKKDCNSRYDYLESMSDPSLGPIGVNQYMYKSDFAILRVSFDVTPDNAKVYENAFNELMGISKGQDQQ